MKKYCIKSKHWVQIVLPATIGGVGLNLKIMFNGVFKLWSEEKNGTKLCPYHFLQMGRRKLPSP